MSSPNSSPDAMTGDRKLRVAVIGAGNWGYHHARVVAARDDTELCGIAGRTAEKTALRAARFGTRPYTDYRQMLEVEQPDLVLLSLPNQQHYEATRSVIELGMPLLVEKPLAFDLSEADALISAAQQRNLFFGINFNHRYAKPMQLAQQAIKDGRLGEITFAHWRFGGDGGTDHPFNNLIETQCHGLDLLEHLCGPISSVMAQMTDSTHAGVYRTLALALRFTSGAVGTLLGSYDSSYAYPDTQVLEINGTKGRVLIEDTARRYTFNSAGSETAEVWQAGYFNDRDRDFHLTFDRHFDQVVQNFRAGKPPPVPAGAGRRALVLAQAAIQSFQLGTRIEV